LLEGEGALEILPAVPTATQDEMPFEQRPGVAENLENFVLIISKIVGADVTRLK
jgi:hypothetical protein